MSSKAITEKPAAEGAGWDTMPETAPSILRADVPTVPRAIGVAGLGALVLGIVTIGFDVAGSPRLIGGGWGSVLALAGLGGLLFHAARESDLGLRRGYAALCIVLLVFTVFTAVYAPQGNRGAWFLPWGIGSSVAALLFLLPFIRNETEELWKFRAIWLLGGVGAVMAGAGLIGGLFSSDFFLPYGLVLALVGLGYLWAFIGIHGNDSDISNRTGLVLASSGLLVIVVTFFQSKLHLVLWYLIGGRLFGFAAGARYPDLSYLTAVGMIFFAVALLYLLLGLSLCSDRPTLVLMRRELSAFFYSPVAYFILFSCSFIAWFDYVWFVNEAERATQQFSPFVEPIVWPYIWGILPVIFFVAEVPLLTMRLLSEEHRMGTLEMLLTVPLQEAPIVMGKFFAALIVFFLTWLPFGIYLIALRMVSGQAFDYRPIISFSIALLVSGGGVLAMGIFLSALTRSQVVAGVLSFMAMILLTSVYFLKSFFPMGWQTVLTYFSYIDLWRNTLQGRLALADLVFHIGFTVLFLFATVKVLEARKWM